MLGYEAAVRAAAILQCWARLTEDLLRNTDKSSLNLRRILTPQLPPCPNNILTSVQFLREILS